jgi:hypothetical protein
MTEGRPWYEDIRRIHDEHFDDPWQQHADDINHRYGLVGRHRLLTHGPDIPLPWFIGDIEAVVPGRWVLAISLNHQVNPDAPYFRSRLGEPHPTADSYWDYCRTFNLHHCYRPFFGPLARVAAAGLGQPLPKERECEFAANQMIFTEICPYGSNQFDLGWSEIEDLLSEDPGFQLAGEVNRLLIESGDPALIMVNGVAAVETFERIQGDALSWGELAHASPDAPRPGKNRKRLWHRCGALRSGTQSVPIVGFPFLRKPRTHNSNAEIAELGQSVRRCVEGLRG